MRRGRGEDRIADPRAGASGSAGGDAKLSRRLHHRFSGRRFKTAINRVVRALRKKRRRASLAARLVAQLGRYFPLSGSDAAQLRSSLVSANYKRGAARVLNFNAILSQIAKESSTEVRPFRGMAAEFANAAAGRG